MKRNLSKKVILIIILLIITSTISIQTNAYNPTNELNNLKYKQKIEIPIDTSLTESKYQPIDIKINFENLCWGLDELNHSIKVFYDDGISLTEIESQIYELKKTDDTHISSCNIVFLIPKDADGKEEYYVFYDDNRVEPTNYVDHIDYEDTHYSYEPVSGQKIDMDFYKIVEDGYVICGIGQRGELFGEGMSQVIIKLKPNSTIFETYNADMFASFDIRYSEDWGNGYQGTTYAKKVTKSVLVDGNLMLKIRLISESPNGVLKSDCTYTYYYSPVNTKRVFADGTNEVLKNQEIGGDKERDPSYAVLTSFKSRSSTIEKMNVGDIFPTFHLYSENDKIEEFYSPSDPDSSESEWILKTTDDIDLGEKAWACQDDPLTGKTNAIIFDKNEEIISDENKGLQIKQTVKQLVKLPGLEADLSSLFFCRNSYEKGGSHNTFLESGAKTKFRGMFVSFEKGGYEAVDRESEIYHKLNAIRPVFGENITKIEEKKRFSLTAYVHLASSFPLGSLLSAATGKNLSYIYAELYKDNGDFLSSGAASRIQTTEGMDLSFENTTLVDKIKIILGLFDWKNATFFKKTFFPDLETGKYIIRIFRENPFFSKNRQYIGFKIMDIKEDTVEHIFCSAEGKLNYEILDQDKNGINGVKFQLFYNDAMVNCALSDCNGSVTLSGPIYPSKTYVLKAIYNGFLIDENEIKLGFVRKIKPLYEKSSINLYNLRVNIKDTWALKPAIDLNPTLSSSNMYEPITIDSEKITNDEYLFTGLISEDYSLSISYKSFEEIKNIKLTKDSSVDVVFPAEFSVELNIMDSYGYYIDKGEVQVYRENKRENFQIDKNGFAQCVIPPGIYEIKTYYDGDEISKQEIDVRGDKKIDIISSKESFLHNIIFYLGIFVVLFSIFYMFWKKKYDTGFKLFIIGLIIIAIISPWWALSGDKYNVITSTETYLVPAKIISITSSNDVFGGEINQVPDEVPLALNLLAIILCLTGLLIFVGIFIKNRFKRISKALSFTVFLLLIIVLVLFFLVMSQITMIGVGSFIGSGDIDTSLPGIAGSQEIPSSWGPGIGFYLIILSCILFGLIFILKKVKQIMISY